MPQIEYVDEPVEVGNQDISQIDRNSVVVILSEWCCYIAGSACHRCNMFIIAIIVVPPCFSHFAARVMLLSQTKETMGTKDLQQ